MKSAPSILTDASALLGLGLPIIGSHLAQMMLHVSDTVLLGRYGTVELDAVVLATSAFFVLFILGSGFGIAVMGMVASALGRGDETLVRRETRMGMWLSIVFGALIMPIFWNAGVILRASGQDPQVAALAQDFLRIAGWGMIPALLVMVLKSYLAALERTQVVLWVTISAVGVNFAIAYCFIFGRFGAPELGVRGAALSSLVTQYMTFVFLAIYATFAQDSRRFTLFRRFWRPDWVALVQVLRLGLPTGLTGLAESGMFVAAAVMMGWIGKVELAAHGIALEITALSFMVHLGLSNAATVRVGRAMGEGDVVAMRRAGMAATVLSLAFVAMMLVLFLSIPHLLIGLFLDPTNADADAIVSFGVTFLAVAALFQLFDAMQVIALGLLRAVQDTRGPMWIAAISYWLVGLPASYALAFIVGLHGLGLWLGLAAGLAAAAVLLMLRFWRGPWFQSLAMA